MRYSKHALQKHQNDDWNANSIRDAYEKGRMAQCQLLEGRTADVLCGYVNGECVGLILSKDKVIITGFAASMDYWQSV